MSMYFIIELYFSRRNFKTNLNKKQTLRFRCYFKSINHGVRYRAKLIIPIFIRTCIRIKLQLSDSYQIKISIYSL